MPKFGGIYKYVDENAFTSQAQLIAEFFGIALENVVWSLDVTD